MRPWAFLLYCSVAFAAPTSSPIVDLGYTKYQGVPLANGITQWLGMRYAAPPVGNLRFRAPQDPIVDLTLRQANQV
jgi:carboxylesterase type B